MGNSNDYNERQRRVLGLQHIRTYEHPWMGTITETIDPQHQTKHLLKVKTCMDQTSHRQQLTKLRNRKVKNSKHLLNLNHYEQIEEEQLCSTVYRIYSLYDFFESDLTTMFAERARARKHFEEEELLNIISSVVRSLIYIQDNGLKNSFISKQSIVSVAGRYLVLDAGLAIRHHPYFSYMLGETLAEDVFLAPEIIEQLRLCASDPYLSPKSDVYSLGVLILHLASLESLATYFDYSTLQVDQEGLLLKIDRIRYSEQFRIILRGMIEVDEEERFGLITLQETLGLASKRQTFRGSRSASVAELMRLNQNRSDVIQSHRQSNRTYSNIETKRKHTNKENSSPSRQLYTLQPIADVDDRRLELSSKQQQLISCKSKQQDTCRSKQTTVINHTVTSGAKHVYFRFDHIRDQHQLSKDEKDEPMKLSKHYRTTQSFNNSPAGFEDDSTIKNTSADRRFGRLNYENTQFYQGEIIDGAAEGNGVLFFEDNRIEYSGNWRSGKYHGFGTLYNRSPQTLTNSSGYKDLETVSEYWYKYEGEFLEGERDGFGTIYLTNSEKFSGCFKRNRAEGYGTYYKKGGQVINGIWADNKLRY